MTKNNLVGKGGKRKLRKERWYNIVMQKKKKKPLITCLWLAGLQFLSSQLRKIKQNWYARSSNESSIRFLSF